MDLPIPLLGKIFDLSYIDYVEHLSRVPCQMFSGRLHFGDVFVERSFDYVMKRLDGKVFFHVEKLARFVAGRRRLRDVPLGGSNSRTTRTIAVFDATRDDRVQDPPLDLVSS